MAWLATKRQVMITDTMPAMLRLIRNKRALSVKSERAPITDPKRANGRKRKSASRATKNAQTSKGEGGEDGE